MKSKEGYYPVRVSRDWILEMHLRYHERDGTITAIPVMKQAIEDFVWKHPIMANDGFGYRPLIEGALDHSWRVTAVEFLFEDAAAAMLFKLTFGE